MAYNAVNDFSKRDYKVGDYVVCVDDSACSGLLTEGKVYEVLNTNSKRTTVIDDRGEHRMFYVDRFRFANAGDHLRMWR